MSTKQPFTREQEQAIGSFEEAYSSHDLRAIGNGRRERAQREVARTYARCLSLGLESALTDNEQAQGRSHLRMFPEYSPEAQR